MARGIFIHRSDSIYDDLPSERYQFPHQYLTRAKQCVGDWIIYYEPRKVKHTRGYFAVAKVQQIIPDPKLQEMYIAIIEGGSYLEFGAPVSFTGLDGVAERGLLNSEGRISGRAQAAVRTISNVDFNRIVEDGLLAQEQTLPRVEHSEAPDGWNEEQEPFELGQGVDRARYFGSRVLRDRNFRQIVLNAYDGRCCVSGLKIINGGGRAEAEAAHIRPVESGGPDLVTNGLALSGTTHWMFDRGLISVSDDLKILISRQVNDHGTVRALVNNTGYMFPPKRELNRPHPQFLEWHRENCFKQ